MNATVNNKFCINLHVLFPFNIATNQYSAALHYYLQAGAVCSDFFTKMVPPDVYTDQVSPVENRLTDIYHVLQA